jgi:hypothetical protein
VLVLNCLASYFRAPSYNRSKTESAFLHTYAAFLAELRFNPHVDCAENAVKMGFLCR